jgi:mono/diheme cytochrome c family protein
MAKRQWLRLGLVGLMMAYAVVSVSCGGGQADPGASAPDGQALLQERCTACHGLERITSAGKAEAAWRDTVGRMVSKGAQLSTAEVDALVAHLAATYGP